MKHGIFIALLIAAASASSFSCKKEIVPDDPPGVFQKGAADTTETNGPGCVVEGFVEDFDSITEGNVGIGG